MTEPYELTDEELGEIRKIHQAIIQRAITSHQSKMAGLTPEEAIMKVADVIAVSREDTRMIVPRDIEPYLCFPPVADLTAQILAITNDYRQQQLKELKAEIESDPDFCNDCVDCDTPVREPDILDVVLPLKKWDAIWSKHLA